METMEHNETGDCDCPVCHLNTKYEAEFIAWKKLPSYITFEMEDRNSGRTIRIENWLNINQENGYELTAINDGLMIMRSLPPQPISQRDIIMEVMRRKKLNDAEFPDTIGPVQ